MMEGSDLKGVDSIASLEYNRHWEDAGERLKYAIDYAQSGLKGLYFSNGAAIISLLTFLGSSQSVREPRAIFWSFVWFSFGVFFALLAYIFGYFSQSYIMQSSYNLSLQRRSDAFGLGESYDSQIWADKGDRSVFLGVASAVGSLAMFIVGAFVALDGIT